MICGGVVTRIFLSWALSLLPHESLVQVLAGEGAVSEKRQAITTVEQAGEEEVPAKSRATSRTQE